MFKNWGTRDWVWLSSYFLVIVSMLIANYYLEWETNLSIISSSISIALAVLAIFLSLKQDSDNKISTDSMRTDFGGRMDMIMNAITLNQDRMQEIVKEVESTETEVEVEEEKGTYTKAELYEYGEKIKQETIKNFKLEAKESIKNSILREALNNDLITQSQKYNYRKELDELILRNPELTFEEFKDYAINREYPFTLSKLLNIYKSAKARYF